MPDVIDNHYTTGTGQVLAVHNGQHCMGRHCTIHNPSDHSMRSFKTHWRTAGPWDIKPSHMERICPHGVGHPDPDAIAFTRERYGDEEAESMLVHGCDGCCAGAYEEK